LKEQLKTNSAKLETMKDEEIDTSEIPPLGEKFFANAKLRMPKNKVSVIVNLDKEVSDWYESQGEDAKNLMNVALRIYAEAHKEINR